MKNAANIGGDNKVGAEVIKCVRTICFAFKTISLNFQILERNIFAKIPQPNMKLVERINRFLSPVMINDPFFNKKIKYFPFW